MKDGQPQWVVVKTASVECKFSREPHDIVKEFRLLRRLSNINVRPALCFFENLD